MADTTVIKPKSDSEREAVEKKKTKPIEKPFGVWEMPKPKE